MVVKEVLEKLDSEDLILHVVWTPVLANDDFPSAVMAQFKINDPRTRHYWDGEGRLGKAYGRLLPLPRGRTFAWDIYFAYDYGVQWSDRPPSPHEWSHQLGRDERFLGDGTRLHGIVEALLNGKD